MAMSMLPWGIASSVLEGLPVVLDGFERHREYCAREGRPLEYKGHECYTCILGTAMSSLGKLIVISKSMGGEHWLIYMSETD